MRNFAFIMLMLLPLSLLAQNDDMFYVPKKEIKQADVAKVLSASQRVRGSYRDVDEYNRRGVYARTAETEVAEVVADDYYVEDEYNYSTRIVRFHNPTIVIGSPYYWNVYPGSWHYGSWYDSYWGISYYDSYWGIGLGASLCWPHTHSYWPHVHSYWHSAPHYHHSVAARPARVVRGRIPVASVSSSVNKNNRVPVAQADNKNGRKPVAQAQSAAKKNNATPAQTKKETRSPGSRQKVEKQSSESRNTRASSATYNRPSSTSVRRQSSSGAERRTPVRSSGGGSRSRGGRR